MDPEPSSFESSDVLATFLTSTPLLEESWRLCSAANTNPPHGFVTEQRGSVGYVAFSGVQMVSALDPSCVNLVPLESAGVDAFSSLYRRNVEGEEAVMVHLPSLEIFMSLYSNPTFQTQMFALMERCKSIIVTGHSIGGTTASLACIWLLSYLQSNFSNHSVLCITFGSPLLGNESLSRAILRERWGGNFCHVVSKYDIMPRLLFAPLLSHITPHLNSLLNFWHLSMTTSPYFRFFDLPLDEQVQTCIFQSVLDSLRLLAETEEGNVVAKSFWPFGNYFFVSEEGGICVDNAVSTVKMMHLLLLTGSPTSSIEDHLKYGDYIEKLSSQCLVKNNFLHGELPESSYEAGVALALQSSGIDYRDPVAGSPARKCLQMARRMGRTPNLNCAHLAIKLSKIAPYRAELEWYKATCDRSDEQMGYYDSFKNRGASKRESRVNMNRHKLGQFWDSVINMLENNQLPHDFHRRAKWVNASQFYKLLVEPLDIAEYYRLGKHREKGHYISNGRERRYQIFDRWWDDLWKRDQEEKKMRSKFASLTQDTCFWAKVEEAREQLDNVRSERDPSCIALLWDRLDRFERYASELVESKEVSADVVAKNSSYSLWVKDYNELKSQMERLRLQFPSFMDGEREVLP